MEYEPCIILFKSHILDCPNKMHKGAVNKGIAQRRFQEADVEHGWELTWQSWHCWIWWSSERRDDSKSRDSMENC